MGHYRDFPSWARSQLHFTFPLKGVALIFPPMNWIQFSSLPFLSCRGPVPDPRAQIISVAFGRAQFAPVWLPPSRPSCVQQGINFTPQVRCLHHCFGLVWIFRVWSQGVRPALPSHFSAHWQTPCSCYSFLPCHRVPMAWQILLACIFSLLRFYSWPTGFKAWVFLHFCHVFVVLSLSHSQGVQWIACVVARPALRVCAFSFEFVCILLCFHFDLRFLTQFQGLVSFQYLSGLDRVRRYVCWVWFGI
jgi:hypothetical protein